MYGPTWPRPGGPLALALSMQFWGSGIKQAYDNANNMSGVYSTVTNTIVSKMYTCCHAVYRKYLEIQQCLKRI